MFLREVAIADKVLRHRFLQISYAIHIIYPADSAHGVCQDTLVAELLNLHVVCVLVVFGYLLPCGTAEGC